MWNLDTCAVGKSNSTSQEVQVFFSSQINNKYCMTCHFKIICLAYLSLRKALFCVNSLIILLTCLAGLKKKYASHRTGSLLNKRNNLVNYIRKNEGLAYSII